jgi:hypothetical protein
LTAQNLKTLTQRLILTMASCVTEGWPECCAATAKDGKLMIEGGGARHVFELETGEPIAVVPSSDSAFLRWPAPLLAPF